MRRMAMLLAGFVMMSAVAWGQRPPLLPEKDVAAIVEEISGARAKRNLEGIAQFHRQRGSKGFHAAAELVAEKLQEYGLNDVAILQFAADGKIFYGTQRSRPAWDAEAGYLSEQLNAGNSDCQKGWPKAVEQAHQEGEIGVLMVCLNMLTNYGADPLALAEDSESADVTAELVDVGAGTKESDYAGKEVKGKIVLVSAQPDAVQDLAVGKFGAGGIVSYAQNQKTAWWGESPMAVRWGHLETFSPNKTFAFMLPLGQARVLQERLSNGEKIRLHAEVKAGRHAGNYEVVTATIAGADPKLKEEEIAFSCHLDHQQPGANDNASGCATILEVARTLQYLISARKLERPARTIRFVFPPEIEGTMALLNAKPEMAKRIRAVVHMDMVGGGPETKAVFHVTRGPMSLPSFVQDVAWGFAEWVNEETYRYAATGKAAYPLVEATGGKEPLQAVFSAYTMGSDHDVYQDSSFGIPAIYLNDWPDRFIHTNLDTPANIDATKLKRVGFIGAASGYFLAGFGQNWKSVEDWGSGEQLRCAQVVARDSSLELADKSWILVRNLEFGKTISASIDRYLGQTDRPFKEEFYDCKSIPEKLAQANGVKLPAPPDAKLIWRRNNLVKGPMAVFGYDYFAAEWAKRGHAEKPKLLEYEGLWGGGEEYAYEVLNFADGKRNAQEIREAVSAEYAPVPLELVVEYLKALEEIRVVEKVEAKN